MDDVQTPRADLGGMSTRKPAGKHKDLVRQPFDSENSAAQILGKFFTDATCLGGRPLLVEYTEFHGIRELRLDERCKNEDWLMCSHLGDGSRRMEISAVKRNEETGVSVSVQ